MRATERTLSVEVRDSLFDPDTTERVAQFRRQPSGDSLYRVFIYLDGPDLPFVREAAYHLHETFSPPVRRVTRTVSDPRCKLMIWTWGLFRVKVIITPKAGRQITLYHDLNYDRQIHSPETTFRAG
jgi:transcription initiation factor IIF auxiliary subunit